MEAEFEQHKDMVFLKILFCCRIRDFLYEFARTEW